MFKERESQLALIPKDSLEYEKKSNELNRQIVEKIDNVFFVFIYMLKKF